MTEHGVLAPLDHLPDFTLTDYERLLATLSGNGYTFRPVGEMPDQVDGRTAYLRHDIDLHIPGIERMAEIEADRGARATYLVQLTHTYNPLYPPNLTILRQIAAMGHEIGLHYDLETYPPEDESMLAHLEWEIGILERAVGVPVRAISMHQPFEGRGDTLRSAEGYVHPHDPRWGEGLTYVSDSCRAWRDDELVRCFGDDAPGRLLLLVHPEVWLGDELDRKTFILGDLLHNMTRPQRDYLELEMLPKWARHPGPPIHDARIAARIHSELLQSEQAGQTTPAEGGQA